MIGLEPPTHSYDLRPRLAKAAFGSVHPKHSPQAANGDPSSDTSQAAFDRVLERHFHTSGLYDNLPALRERYRTEGYVELPNFYPEAISPKLKAKILATLRHSGIQRNGQNPTSKTPRKFRSLSHDDLRDTHLPLVYQSKVVRKLLKHIVGERVAGLSHEHRADRFVAHMLNEKTHVHGYHIDPFPLAMIAILKAPPKNAGGFLKYIVPPAHERPVDPDSMQRLERTYGRSAQRRYPKTGSVYLLAAREFPHMVAPLTRDLGRGEERVSVTSSFGLPDSDRRTPQEIQRHFDKELGPAFPEAFAGAAPMARVGASGIPQPKA